MKWLLLALALLSLAGCNPFYVVRAAYEQGKILLRREDIAELLSSAALNEEERSKLSLVLEARAYAQKMGLDPGGSFKKFARLDRNELAWVLVASKPDAFMLFQWWFPIVGSVPYKGYFERDSADKAADSLRTMGYETFTRTTSAISTLGWFDDPLLSTTLRAPAHSLANTIIHESLHSTVWIPGQVDFNESLANFVGLQGAVDFFRDKLAHCPATADCSTVSELAKQAALGLESELRFSRIIEALYNELNSLYSSALPREEKLRERVRIFERHLAPIREKNPKMKSFQNINNAEIIQVKLYTTALEEFAKLFSCKQRSWFEFIEVMRAIAEQIEQDGSKSAWGLLQNYNAC